jgi:hypothetical protein
MAPHERPSDRAGATLYLVRIPSVVTLVCGIWLLASPFVLGNGTDVGESAGFWNEILAGLAIAAASVVRLLAPMVTSPVALLLAALGGWLIIGPSALGYATDGGWPALMTSDITTGVVVLSVSLASWVGTAWLAVHAQSGRHPDRANTIPD